MTGRHRSYRVGQTPLDALLNEENMAIKDRFKTRLALLIVAVIAALGAVLVGCTAAGASVTPRYPVCHHGYCYTHPAVLTNQGAWAAEIKPRSIYMGQGGAPYFTALRWPTYTHGKAVAKGKLHAIKAGCTPASSCRYYVVKVKFVLTSPKWCNNQICGGGWYYSRGHAEWRSSVKLNVTAYWHTSAGFWEPGK